MEDNVKLTEEEARLVVAYQKALADARIALGSLRSRYLLMEGELMDRIGNAEKDLLSHLRLLAQSKDMPADGDWAFDSATFSFVRRQTG